MICIENGMIIQLLRFTVYSQLKSTQDGFILWTIFFQRQPNMP